MIDEIEGLLRQTQLPSIEAAIRMARSQGFMINNLFQTMAGTWQCNLRRREPRMFFEYSWGPSPSDAILKALIRGLKGDFAAAASDSTLEGQASVVGSTRAAEMAMPGDDDMLGAPAADDDLDDLLG